MAVFIFIIILAILFGWVKGYIRTRILTRFQYFPQNLFDEIKALNSSKLYIDQHALYMDGDVSCVFGINRVILFPIYDLDQGKIIEYSQIETIQDGYKYLSMVEDKLISLKERNIAV